MSTTPVSPSPDELVVEAYHEAGHFVVALALGRNPTRIVVGQEHGFCTSDIELMRVGGRAGAFNRQERRGLTAVLCGGMEAERVHLGKREGWIGLGLDDDAKCQDFIEQVHAALPDETRRDFVNGEIRQARSHAGEILRANWKAVEALAQRLSNGGDLDGVVARDVALSGGPIVDFVS